MPRSNFYNEPDESKQGKFNAAMLQMQRINKLQDRINECNVNLLAKNLEFDAWNFEIKFRDLTSLFIETSPKLKETMRKTGVRIRKLIIKLMKINPVNIEKKKVVHPHSTYLDFNKENWVKLRETLFIYEFFVKDCLEETGMNNPTEDDSGL